MIGIPFELDLSTLPAPFEPKRIIREEFHWPGYREPGEANNVDQIGAWSLLAERCLKEVDEMASVAGATDMSKWGHASLHNAREWVMHYHRMDGGQKDEAHLFMPGVRHYLRLVYEWGGRAGVTDAKIAQTLAEASSLFAIYGPRSFGNLARYVGKRDLNARPWYEPRLLGRALSNCAAYAYHQIETGQRPPDLPLLSWAVRKLSPQNFPLLEFALGASATGWGKSASGVRYLVLKGYSRYEPSIEDPYWHYIPWQYFSTLAYGLLECFGLLDDEARRDAREILRSLHALANEVTLGFTQWGGTNEATSEHDEGMVRRLIPFQGDNKLMPLEQEESSSAERTYSFRWLSENARPMMANSHVAFQPTCLPLKNREELLES